MSETAEPDEVQGLGGVQPPRMRPGRHGADFGWSVGVPVQGWRGAHHDEDARASYPGIGVHQSGPHRIRHPVRAFLVD